MTPQEYLQHRERIDKAIMELKALNMEMCELAEAAPFPANVRQANADDIQPGAIIWYKRDDSPHYDRPYYWNVVETPLHYGDAFKAYIAEDGCRYGLQGAWVEVA